MDLQNLAYAVIQAIHNFGAAAVVGGAAFTLWRWPVQAGQDKSLAWLVLAGWAVQGASGASFGAVSWLYYGQFPDIHGIAVAALLIKMACAAAGFLLAALYLLKGAAWNEHMRQNTWRGLTVLAATALTAAAFLRWFS